MLPNQLDHDLYLCLNKMFNNCFPEHVQTIKIEMGVNELTSITVKYFPDLCQKEPVETIFGLIEYPKEVNLNKIETK